MALTHPEVSPKRGDGSLHRSDSAQSTPALTQGGFTLIELMIVVAVVAILAAAAVFGYSRYTRRARTSEVYAMIAAIKSAEESYRAETGQYLSTGNNENDFLPALLGSGEPTRKEFNITGKPAWQALGVSPPAKHLYCGYVAIAGEANDFTGGGPRGISLFGGEVPRVPWFYIRATCNLDGNNSVNSFYETTHDRQTIYIENEGR